MGGSSSGRRQARAARARGAARGAARGGGGGGGGGAFRPQQQQQQRPASPEDSHAHAHQQPLQLQPLQPLALDFADHAISSGVGFDLLARMGYRPEPPAARAAGDCRPGAPRAELQQPPLPPQPPATGPARRTEPITIVVRRSRAGLGAPAPLEHHAHSLPAGAGAGLPRSGARDFRGGCHARRARDAWLLEDDPGPSAAVLAASLDSMSLGSLASDPLRPRCSHNSDHVVADLKQKQRHEKRCPDNPNRQARGASLSPAGSGTSNFAAAPPRSREHIPAPNQHDDDLTSDTLSDDEEGSDEDDLMSDMSQDD